MSQYIVALADSPNAPRLQDVLARYPEIKVLQQLEGQGALVEMPQSAVGLISQEHPELIIEANIRYALQGAR